MTFHNDTERERRRKSDDNHQDDAAPRKPRKPRGQSAEVGDALRTVYQRAVDETIPPEMLDLLGKLG